MASRDRKAQQKKLKDDHLRAEQAAAASRMPLDAAQLQQLLDHVDAAVLAAGCDHRLRATEAWAREHGIDVERLHEGLEQHGGFCDCEVVMNLDVADVFTPRRQRSRGASGALSHAVIHSLDVTIPLGRPPVALAGAVSAVLDHLAAAEGAVFGIDLAGVRLEATDTGRSWGDGEPVRAESGALVALLSGRTLPDGRTLPPR